MTYANLLFSSEGSLSERIQTLRDAWVMSRAKANVYAQTYRELDALTERELADIGMSRGDIDRVAREAAEIAV